MIGLFIFAVVFAYGALLIVFNYLVIKAKLETHKDALKTAKAMMDKSRETQAKLDELQQEDINILLRPSIRLVYSNGVKV